ncbi:hypothetical protein F4561_000649 [Lipingzhangella halophila]|uniref:DUF4345 domain-containing protein n=1 Tax=Lipingzhangella halophila TaxID=1783352 RepID=A0A7W7RDA9_9ACTN|nr:hypothetical protein [Lipingzhangella halophila]MBB4929829.1 hypothetical protein [Lipingzhangella halophila]
MLMFIGAAIGLLFALLFGAAAAIPEVTRGMEEGATMPGLRAQDLPLLFGMVAFVVGVYGLVSLVLASLMGRRSLVVFWIALIFQVLMLFLPLSSLMYGAVGTVLPLLFTAAIIVLLLLPASRAFYWRR